MNKQEYLDQRNALIAEAEILVAEAKAEDAESKMAEVEGLDAKWAEIAKSQANLEALKDAKEIANIEDYSVELKGDEKKVEIIKDFESVEAISSNEYRNAFLKKLQGKDLTQQENALVTAGGAIPTQTMTIS